MSSRAHEAERLSDLGATMKQGRRQRRSHDEAPRKRMRHPTREPVPVFPELNPLGSVVPFGTRGGLLP